jgi:hypothetical protein
MKYSEIEEMVRKMPIREVKKTLARFEEVEGEQSDEFEMMYSVLFEYSLEFDVNRMTMSQALRTYSRLHTVGFQNLSEDDLLLERLLNIKIMNDLEGEDSQAAWRAAIGSVLQRKVA